MNGAASAGPPLRDVRVLDLTRLLPGPACTLHLADLGADVVKIEDTGAGDYAPAAMRAVLHRNKRALRLDLKQPAGVETLHALVAGADVLVESFRSGVMDRLGIGYAALSEVNRRLVFCSITGWGQAGPLADQAGHDINYCAMAGAASQMGTRSGELALSNLQIADLMGGAMTAAVGILAALHDARRSGRGRHVDIAMADSVFAHLVIPLATRAAEGHARPAGQDNLSGALPCYGYYATADDRVLAVCALEPKFWEAFCDVIARPDLKPLGRPPSRAECERVRAEVAAVLSTRTLADWQHLLQGADCCVTPVLDFDEALAHAQFAGRGLVHEAVHPVYGTITHLACPVRMTGFEFAVARPAPMPGEHSDELLREAGYSIGHIATLRALGAVA